MRHLRRLPVRRPGWVCLWVSSQRPSSKAPSPQEKQIHPVSMRAGLPHVLPPFSLRKVVRRGETKPSPSLAAQVPQRWVGTEPGVVSSAHQKGLEVSKRQDRGCPGTEVCWGGRSGGLHPKRRGHRASSPSWSAALLSPSSGRPWQPFWPKRAKA